MADDDPTVAEDAWTAATLILEGYHDPDLSISVEYQQARIAAAQVEATMQLVKAVDRLALVTGACHGKMMTAENIIGNEANR